MSQIGDDVEAIQTTIEGSPHAHVETTTLSSTTTKEQQDPTGSLDAMPSNNDATDHVTLTSKRRTLPLSLNDMNPPDI